MNTPKTLELLWKIEEELAAGERPSARARNQILRTLRALRDDQLRVQLGERFLELEREPPPLPDRFGWDERARIERPQSVEEVVGLLADRAYTPIGRAHSGLPPDGPLIDLRDLDAVYPVTDARTQVDADRLLRVEAGITLAALVEQLEVDQLVPAQLGGSLDQSLAGAIHTGVHAPGRRPLADAVVSVDVVLDGQVQRFEPTDGITDPVRCPHLLIQDDAAFDAMAVNRGTIGVAVAYTLRVEDRRVVRCQTTRHARSRLGWAIDRARAGERLKLSISPHHLIVHSFADVPRAQVDPELVPTEPLAPLQDIGSAVGPDLLGWLVALCPNFLTDELRREGRSATHIGPAHRLETSPSSPAWRLTRIPCALDQIEERIQALAPLTVHPIQVVFALPSPHHALLPDQPSATLEVRTPWHAPPPPRPAIDPPVAFQAQRELRTRSGSKRLETLVLKGLQQDLPPDEAKKLLEAMKQEGPFQRALNNVLVPEPMGARSGNTWRNWLGEERRRVDAVDVDDWGELSVALAQRGDRLVRMHGKRHADNWVSPPDEGSLSLDLMDRWPQPSEPLDVYERNGRHYARAFGWERLGNFFDRLQLKGLAILNTGSFSGQSIAGPLSVATHGSGADFGAMSDGVVEVDILGADGVVRRIRRADWPRELRSVRVPGGAYFPQYVDLPFDLAVVNLGCFGIVLAYVVEVEKTYRLVQQTKRYGLREGLDEALALLPERRHVELVMVPDPVEINGDEVQVVVLDRRKAKPDEPNTEVPKLPWLARLVAGMGPWGQKQVAKIVQNVGAIRNEVFEGALTSQVGFTNHWRKVLIRDTGIYAHGFEVHVPIAHLHAAAKAIVAGIRTAAETRPKTRPTAPVGIRFVKAGSQAMAMNHHELKGVAVDLWCTFEIPRLLGSARPERIVEAVIASLQAADVPFRPHWGQYFPPSVELKSLYPRLGAWLAARDLLDPQQVFFPRALKAKLTLGRGITAAEVAPTRGEQRRLLVVPPHPHAPEAWRRSFQEALYRALDVRRLPHPQLVWLTYGDLLDQVQLDETRIRQSMLATFGRRLREDLPRDWMDRVAEHPDWNADHVARWLESPTLRESLRLRLFTAISELEPAAVVGHGLGSLVAYDTLTHAATAPTRPVDLVTLASPLAHPGLRHRWGGSLPFPRGVRHWFHVWHRDDPLFTGPVGRSRVYDVEIRDPADDPHCAPATAGATVTTRDVWSVVLGDAQPRRRTLLDASRHRRAPRKALLVGIDVYRDPAFAPLQGSVNDVLAMSELLQARYGYRAEDIRVLTDTRATTDRLRNRLAWLLANTSSMDQRVFYFSGHGTQLPAYNALEVVDRVDECLVTHDFDWNRPETAFVDDDFMELYTQLPHGARFTAIFDCCHAAGMSRSGGGQVRGVGVPEDVLHRLRRFSGGEWRMRTPQPRSRAVRNDPGPSLAHASLGSAQALRPRQRTRETDPVVRGHSGPYLPVLLYATQEDALAYEYRDGRQVRGAFSWALTRALADDPSPTYAGLFEHLEGELLRVVGSQSPDLEGPGDRLDLGGRKRHGRFDL